MTPLPGENEGETLVLFASHGNVEELAKLLARNRDALDYGCKSGGYTALTLACRNNKVDSVKYLLAMGADATKKATCGWTPMIEAARTGSLVVLQSLWNHKPKPSLESCNDFGWTPIIEGKFRVARDLVGARLNGVPMRVCQPVVTATLRWYDNS